MLSGHSLLHVWGKRNDDENDVFSEGFGYTARSVLRPLLLLPTCVWLRKIPKKLLQPTLTSGLVKHAAPLYIRVGM